MCKRYGPINSPILIYSVFILHLISFGFPYHKISMYIYV